MLLPINCLTCNKIIGNKWNAYVELLKNNSINDTFKKLKIQRYCCKRMFLSHVDLISIVLEKEQKNMK